MRDKSHADQVERWALFVKNNPRSAWSMDLKNLIDSQITKANDFYKYLSKTSKGREKIRRLKKLH